MKTYRRLINELTEQYSEELHKSLMDEIKEISDDNSFKKYNVTNNKGLKLNDNPILVKKLEDIKSKYPNVYTYVSASFNKTDIENLHVAITTDATDKALIDVYKEKDKQYLHVYQQTISIGYKDLQKNVPYIIKSPKIVNLISI